MAKEIKNNKKLTLKSFLGKNYIVLTLLFLAFLLSIIVLGSIYLANRNYGVGIAFIITVASLGLLIVLYSLYIITKLSNSIYKDLYKGTLRNYENILEQGTKFNLYENKYKLEEIKQINNLLTEIIEYSKNVIVDNGRLDYSKIELNFVSGYINLVTYDSFVFNYNHLIDVNKSFRSAFVSIYFPREIKSLSDEEIKDLLDSIDEVFPYKYKLVADHSRRNELIVFIPRFDSIDRLNENFTAAIKKIHLTRNSSTGYSIITPKIAAVIYPYSSYDDILSDLVFAKRQGENVFLYIPEKVYSIKNKTMSVARNLNEISLTFEQLSSLANVCNTLNDYKIKLNDIMASLCNYFEFSSSGVFSFNETTQSFESFQFYSKIFTKENKLAIPYEFVLMLEKHADKDGSYFFSNRSSASSELGVFLDKFGIESGYFFLFKDKGQTSGFSFFVNNRPSNLNSYVREGLLMFSFYVSSYVYKMKNLKSEIDKETRLNDLLKITGCHLYSINKKDFTLISYSPSLKALIPTLTEGCKCYEGIHGKSKHCETCPLTSGRKNISTIKNDKYEGSLVLNNVGENETYILLSPLTSSDYSVRERFDHDLLINSTYSFIENLKDRFLISERGYIIILNVDNINSLIADLKSEQINSYFRNLFNDVKKIKTVAFEIYSLTNATFAIVIPNVTNNDAIELAEKIYELSKKNYFNNEANYGINFSYFIQPYPFGYQNPEDFTKYIKTNTQSRPELINKDYIYVMDSKYSRSASHKKYLVDALDNNISKNTFRIKMQPILSKNSKRIINAELLFRIADLHRGGELNTYEVIQAAASENKIDLITGLLIDYIGTFYKEYEKVLFKKYDLNHLSLNTDFSFFNDIEFINRINNMVTTTNLPDKFLHFEISEKEVANHYSEFETLISTIKSNNIVVICDNFTGGLVSLNKLSELGFTGIKIDRSIVSNIDSDNSIYEGLVNIVESANQLQLSITCVGVENLQQYSLLKKINVDFNLQGYYFYRNLDEKELLNVFMKSEF